ncbi:hypothetical protein [Anaeromyxobacter oryzae]|uniref:Uncharacterized protein n=1 Tax=Anaeromyxobacter oryzae TaxID=2918170 RepID=A0ABM7WQK7_9BACT|nr:hypothetical protein [Anaeromyxobacter oryzae]BDG01745.1 hypothetical protein AMOR_07410 [Anaeromyxobacter oryzae]
MRVKKGFAVEFINRIRTMESGELNALIVREAGEELAQFFLSYSANLISRDPERVLENTSSLMLMGYLIRAAEERNERWSEPVLQA